MSQHHLPKLDFVLLVPPCGLPRPPPVNGGWIEVESTPLLYELAKRVLVPYHCIICDPPIQWARRNAF